MELANDLFGAPDAPPLLVVHGLLGSARNWGGLAKRLAADGRRVVAVDMRNHGRSGWDDAVGYPAMAGDLAQTLDAQEIRGATDVIGHSMGGKAAMALALTQPGRVRRLLVADIAPIAYAHSHGDLIDAMLALDLAAVRRRADADAALAAAVPDRATRAFVVQNLAMDAGGARWRPNLAVLRDEMATLTGWPQSLAGGRFDGPALFLRGARSDYVPDAAATEITARFPAATIETLADAGHWLHAERPDAFFDAAIRFLAASPPA